MVAVVKLGSGSGLAIGIWLLLLHCSQCVMSTMLSGGEDRLIVDMEGDNSTESIIRDITGGRMIFASRENRATQLYQNQHRHRALKMSGSKGTTGSGSKGSERYYDSSRSRDIYQERWRERNPIRNELPVIVIESRPDENGNENIINPDVDEVEESQPGNPDQDRHDSTSENGNSQAPPTGGSDAWELRRASRRQKREEERKQRWEAKMQGQAVTSSPATENPGMPNATSQVPTVSIPTEAPISENTTTAPLTVAPNISATAVPTQITIPASTASPTNSTIEESGATAASTTFAPTLTAPPIENTALPPNGTTMPPGTSVPTTTTNGATTLAPTTIATTVAPSTPTGTSVPTTRTNNADTLAPTTIATTVAPSTTATNVTNNATFPATVNDITVSPTVVSTVAPPVPNDTNITTAITTIATNIFANNSNIPDADSGVSNATNTTPGGGEADVVEPAIRSANNIFLRRENEDVRDEA